MDTLKYVKLENEDGSYSDSIPLAVDGNYVDVNGNTLTEELNLKADKTITTNLQNQINSLASGSPLVASSVSGMTDTTRIYVNTTDGHWYWYDGDSWEDGGVYQATQSPEVEDGRISYNDKEYSKIGDAIRGQVENIYDSIESALNGEYILNNNYLNDKFVLGEVHNDPHNKIDDYNPSTNTAFYQEYLDVSDIDKIYFDDTAYKMLFIRYDENYTKKSYSSWFNNSPMNIDNLGYPYYVIEIRRLDNADLDIDDIKNVVYYKNAIENNLIDNETFSEYSQSEISINFELSNGYYVPGNDVSTGSNWQDSLVQNDNSQYLENSLDLSSYVGETLKISTTAFLGNSTRAFGFCNSSNIISSMFQEKLVDWEYDSKTKRYILELPITDTNFFFSFAKLSNITPINVAFSIIVNTFRKKVIEYTNESIPYYVSENGDDNNIGISLSTAFATVNHALSVGASNIYIAGGTYEQTIDLTKSSKSIIRITKLNDNENVTFKDPSASKITSESSVEGYIKVYKASYSGTIDTTRNIWIFQENVPEGLISNEERHPLQRGREYRLDDTKIQICSANSLSDALTEIENFDGYKWYLDSENHYLYFSRPHSVSAQYPIYIAKGKNLFKTNTIIEQSLIITGINSKYLVFNVDNKANVILTDCKSENVFGGGAFVYDRCLNGKFIRCEAARTFIGSNGDGFNGHSNNTGNAYSKQTTIQLIECWSHDNNDDGYSDHERSETNIFGGLFEYNGKGGIVPSYGSHCTCHDVYSRKNYTGFYYTGTAAAAEGGKYGQMICYNCVSQNNNTGGYMTGYRVDGTGNKMELINCKSIGNNYGYTADANSNIARLIDCSTTNDTYIKGGAGQFEIINTDSIV